jgi:arylsulfatase A-like enzyme/Flp pilus assembly protein TadD
VALAGWLLAGCGGAPEPPRPARHLVLVTIDTLRADRVGAVGGSVPTPHLERIARDGAIATEATTHAPLTRPAHVSLFTGRLPSEHGIRDNASPTLGADQPLLAERLQRAGFQTAGFVSSIVLADQSGLGRGFDTWSAEFEGDADAPQFLNTVQRRGDEPTAEAITWLEQHAGTGERLFAWLHLYDPHDPYEPPEPWASRYAERPYDGEVAWSDELVGRLDEALARLGLRDDTLLVVTADHGEGLGDHGETLHGFFAYQTTLRVPLLLRGPGVAPGSRLGVTVRLIDLLPTALELLGLPVPAEASGHSLAGALGGGAEPEEPVTYAETLVPLLHFGWSDLRVLREGRWKYIQAPRPELYDLRNDPGEQHDLAAAEPARVEAMRAALAGFLEAERAAPAPGSVPPELLEQLGALGYVGGGAPAETSTPGADPKDRIEQFRIANGLMREGLIAFHDGDIEGSAARFGRLLEMGVVSFEAHYYRARALFELKRYDEAARHYAEATGRLPTHAAAWEGLAESRRLAGDVQGALAALAQARQVLPDNPGLLRREALARRQRGDLAGARAAYEAALPLEPQDARLRVLLAEVLRDEGSPEAAIARLREAVELDPAPASYWNSLGMLLGAQAQLEPAVAAFREARERDAADPRYAYNLGLALLRLGRGPEARALFEETLQLQPGFRAARERLSELGAGG